MRADKLRPAKRDGRAQKLGNQGSWTWSFGRVQSGITSRRRQLAVIFASISLKRCDSPLMFEEGGIVEARPVDQPKR